MAFPLGFNTTTTLGLILGNATQYTTGDIFLTTFIIMVVFLAIAMLFGIPIEYTMILLLPLLLSFMAYYGAWVPVGAVILIYLTIIFGKRFIIK